MSIECDALKPAGQLLNSATECIEVEVPCIVNTIPINANDEIVLAWAPPKKPSKRNHLEITRKNAFDILKASGKKTTGCGPTPLADMPVIFTI